MKIQLRHDTTSNWESYNPILSAGEVGVDTTLGKLKVGNGTSTWSQLDYIGSVDLSNYYTKTQADNKFALQTSIPGTATTSTPGIVQPDGTTITINDGVISSTGGGSTPANMVTTDTDQTITGIKTFYNGLKSETQGIITNAIKRSENVPLWLDSGATLQIGKWTDCDLSILGSKLAYVVNDSAIPITRLNSLGNEITCYNVDSSNISTYLPTATTSALGVVQPDDSTIGIDASGVLSVKASYADTSLSNLANAGNIAIAHNAMPSYTYDDLTLGASGATYTAPADGYYYAKATATASGQELAFVSTLADATTLNYASNVFSIGANTDLHVTFRVKKNNVIALYYNAPVSIFRFIYAVGSESEAS